MHYLLYLIYPRLCGVRRAVVSGHPEQVSDLGKRDLNLVLDVFIAFIRLEDVNL